ncbi:MAG: phenylacetate--CoA ligase family protein [Rhodobacteraceae bacterium]|nr:phenylacetate--CoA ligase family protein [Paracoccaceae bacterium]
MSDYFDDLEIRSADQRAADLASALPTQILNAKRNAPGYAVAFADVDPAEIKSLAALAKLPVLRKSDLGQAQVPGNPMGGFGTRGRFDQLFMSPGPIFEPGMRSKDWWRMGRVLYAAGLRAGDVAQNCFSYHLTPAGVMFDNACAAIGATVIPAGPGQTEMQVHAAHTLGSTAYIGTPDYLKIILDKADELGITLDITKAAVGGGVLFPSLRQEYADRGISCLQGYGTADLGNVAYESSVREGMIVDEGVIVEIVTPGTGVPVADGAVGEVVVTTLNSDYPLIRFATGDLSAVMPGESPCGRTNTRIRGWMGRADQTAKIKGMFVRPEQVGDFVARHADVTKARIVITRAGEVDHMAVLVETSGTPNVATLEASVKETLKLHGPVHLRNTGDLPDDGKVIDDQRSYD